MSVRFRVKRETRGPNFLVKIPLTYEHLFYRYFVRRSVSQATNGINVYTYINVNFSSTDYDRGLILFAKIYVMNEHLIYKYFVRMSVSYATKEIYMKICYDC